MNIILFGPPGIGKSTIIGVLKRNGIAAIDLEDVYPSKIRFQLPSMVDGVVFGGADLNPARSYPNAIKVLLCYSDQRDYDEQRTKRDNLHPAKADQKRHSIWDWKKNDYDHFVYLDNIKGRPGQIMYHPVMKEAYDEMKVANQKKKGG